MASLELSHLSLLALARNQAGQYREADRTITEAMALGAKLVERDPKDFALAFRYLAAVSTTANAAQ